jgi:DNA-binding transcriptional MerR regulator
LSKELILMYGSYSVVSEPSLASNKDEMTIKEFSERTKITISAIRYYDKLGLFPGLSRDNSGYRDFSEKDITWALFINRLKDTGMKIREILIYSNLRDMGDSTIAERLEILENHRYELKKKIDTHISHLENIDKKVELYKKLLP